MGMVCISVILAKRKQRPHNGTHNDFLIMNYSRIKMNVRCAYMCLYDLYLCGVCVSYEMFDCEPYRLYFESVVLESD